MMLLVQKLLLLWFIKKVHLFFWFIMISCYLTSYSDLLIAKWKIEISFPVNKFWYLQPDFKFKPKNIECWRKFCNTCWINEKKKHMPATWLTAGKWLRHYFSSWLEVIKQKQITIRNDLRIKIKQFPIENVSALF